MTATISETEVRSLLAGISSADARQREESADRVTDVSGVIPANAVNEVARALVEAAVSETASRALESQLNALNEMTGSQPFDPAIVAPLLSLDRAPLGGSENEALDELRAYHRGEF